MTTDDLPLVKRWLAMPHVTPWWGDANEQLELVSYLQCYDLTAWNSGFGPQPLGTRGIDQFIGEPDLVDRGHGSAFIRTFAGGLLAAGTPRLVTDPDPANARAVRVYEKAGFHRDRMVDTPDGPGLLMVRSRA